MNNIIGILRSELNLNLDLKYNSELVSKLTVDLWSKLDSDITRIPWLELRVELHSELLSILNSELSKMISNE